MTQGVKRIGTPEEIREMDRAYFKKYREGYKAKQAASQKTRREKDLEASRSKEREYARGWRAKNKNYIAARWYKVSEETILEIKARGKCDICSSTQFLNIDHCHNTGKVRGLLCTGCNMFLGKLEKRLSVLDKYLSYLNREADGQ